jgi:hypothetical protein
MLKVRLRSILILIAVFALYTCIDPYRPKLTGYDSLLVVDGLITDANSSYTIKLSRTFQDQNSIPAAVSDATLFISDDTGNKSNLKNKGSGIYKTDSLEFKGTIGRTYILHILTHAGEEYASEPCLMQSVPDIDSIYFEKDNKLVNNGTESQEGIEIYLDSKGGNNDQYYRWAFEETWKFKVPEPKRYDFDMADSSITAVTNIKEYCWKSRKSDEILIHSIYTGEDPHILKEPIFFIAADKSDRLLIQYSILVSQYSISKNEYDFWNNLKQVNESGGDIFAKQPFTVISNIHNNSNGKERVLGYFQVSSVKQRRKNIIFNDVARLNLSFYQLHCERFVKGPWEYSLGPAAPPPTWDDLYSIFCVTSNYYFVEPIYITGSIQSKFTLYRMVFARPECANCELTGTAAKPDFWIDIN